MALAVLAGLLLLLLAYWLRYRRRQARCEAPLPAGGAYIELAHGRCHYIVEGHRNSGPLVVLVHGFVGSSSYMRFLAAELETRRVLRFDLWGRGWSDHPDAPHTAALFAAQLSSLLFALGEAGPIDLVGYSMGGCVVAKFAACHAARLRSLVLLAPAGTRGMPAVLRNLLPLIARLPLLPEVLAPLKFCSAAQFEAGERGEWQDPDGAPHWRAFLAEELRRLRDEPGLAAAALNSARNFELGGCEGYLATVGAFRRRGAGSGAVAGAAAAGAGGAGGAGGGGGEGGTEGGGEGGERLPVLVAWGARDRACPVAGLVRVRALVPHAEVWLEPEAGHALPIERFAETAARLSAFWGACESRKGVARWFR